MEIDYKEQVDEAIQKANDMVAKGNSAGAVESLAQLEKLTRLGSDMHSNTRILRHMVGNMKIREFRKTS